MLGELTYLYAKGGIRTFRAYAATVKQDAPEIWEAAKDRLVAFWRYASADIDGLDNPTRPEAAAIIAELDRPKPPVTPPSAPPPKPPATQTALPPEAVAKFNGNRMTVETTTGGRFLVKGDTYQHKDIFNEIKNQGGDVEWLPGQRAWRVSRDAAEAVAERLPEPKPRGDTGGSELPRPTYEVDARLGALRNRLDGRADARETDPAYPSLVGEDTQGLIRRGAKFGMPEDVLAEQVEDIGKIVAARQRGSGGFVLASDPGSGKTFVLGGAIREMRKRGAARIVYVTLNKGLIDQIKKDLADYGVNNVQFITYTDMLSDKLKPFPTDVIIFDEAHAAKTNNDSQRSKIAAEWMKQANFTVLSSGTPMEDPVQAEFMDPTGIFREAGGFINWAIAYGATGIGAGRGDKRTYSGVVWRQTSTSAKDNLDAQRYLLKAGLMTSRKARIPGEQIDSRLEGVNSDPSFTRIDGFMSQAADAAGETLNQRPYAAMWVVNFTKRILEASKLRNGINIARDAVAEGRWPIVFIETKAEKEIDIPEIMAKERAFLAARAATRFGDTPPSRADFGVPPDGVTEVLDNYMRLSGQSKILIPSAEDVVSEAFPGKVDIFTGTVGEAKARENLERWRESKTPRVLLATMAKGGTGLSLHDKTGAHPTWQINVTLPWTATQVEQVTKRSVRYGLVGTAKVSWLFSNQIPFEIGLAKKVSQRMSTMGALVKGEVPETAQAMNSWRDRKLAEAEEGERLATEGQVDPIAAAKARVGEAWNAMNVLRAAPNVREELKAEAEMFLALFNLARAYAREGVKTAADFAKRARLKLNAATQRAWDDAVAGRFPETSAPLTDDERKAIRSLRLEARVAREAVTETPEGPAIPTPTGIMGATPRKVSETKGVFRGLKEDDSAQVWSKETKAFVDEYGDRLGDAISAVQSDEFTDAHRIWVGWEVADRAGAALAELEARGGRPGQTRRMTDLMARAARTAQAASTGAGKALRSQGINIQRRGYLAPMFTYLRLVRERQARLPFPEIKSEVLRQWLTASRKEAVEKVLEDTSKADALVANALGKTAKELGVDWQEIMESAHVAQENTRAGILAKIREHPGLANMKVSDAVELANLLGEQWEKKRNEAVQKALRSVLGKQARESTVRRVQKALPRIIRWSNLGALSEEAFRDAVAPEFGLASIDGAVAEQLVKMAQAAQAVGGVNRDRIIRDMYRLMQKSGGVRFGDIVRDYWYAAVLSGTRTMIDSAVNIANGALVTGIMGVRVPPRFQAKFWGAYKDGLAQAVWDALPIIVNGELHRAASYNPDRPGNALEAISEGHGAFGKLIGVGKYVSRIMTAIDHMNALGTREAGLVYAMARSGKEDVVKMLSVTEADIALARVQAEMEGTPKDLMKRRVQEILRSEVPPELHMDAKDISESVNFTNTPKGFAGLLYAAMERAAGGRQLIPGLPLFKMSLGLAFVRFVSNMANAYLNFVPPISLFRYWAAGTPGRTANKEYSSIERDVLLGQAAIGAAMAAWAATVFLGDDEEDPSKRSVDIVGSLKSLTQDQRNQLKENVMPHSIRIGNKHYSYRQMAFGGILGAIGELRDRQIYAREKWDQESLARKFADAGFAGLFFIRESTAISQFMELVGFSNAQKYDLDKTIERSVPRFMAGLAGSFVPNIVKEMDAWSDPSIFKAETAGEYFLQQVPFGRRTVGPGPVLNVLGEPVKVERYPWSRWIKSRSDDPAWSTLGRLSNKGIFVPVPGDRMMELPDGRRREMTRGEDYRYRLRVGREYRRYFRENGRDLLAMPKAEALDAIKEATRAIRDDVADGMTRR